MRKVWGPNGRDNTWTLADGSPGAFPWLKANRVIEGLPHLYLIGEVGDPNAIWATDYSRALTWGPGTFPPAVISRGTVTTKIGLDVATLDLTYSPANRTITQDTRTTSPLHLAQYGFYDNWRVRIWRVIMPTPGDCNTFGAYELFGGRIANSAVDRLKMVCKVNSWLDVLNQKVPANIIENTNVLASYAGAHPPPGFSSIPRFSVAAGSDETVLILDCTSTAGHIFDENIFAGGWLMFDFASAGSPDETLGGFWSVVGGNKDYIDGLGYHHNRIQLYTPLLWPPTPGGDTCFVSAPFPVDASDPGASATDPIFKYVPAPETAF
jgi:Uncharacterized conserved protein (DUF2163)